MQVKSEVFSTIAAQSEAAAPLVWGWLEPGSSALPHIQLRGNAVALGRGSGLHKSHAAAASPRGGSPRPSGFTEEYPLSAMNSACLTQTAPPRQATYCPQYCEAVLTSLLPIRMECSMPEGAESITACLRLVRARLTVSARLAQERSVCGRQPLTLHGS